MFKKLFGKENLQKSENAENENSEENKLPPIGLGNPYYTFNYTEEAKKEFEDSLALNQSTIEEPEDLDILFAQNFTQNHGKFVYCESIDDLRVKLAKFFDKYCQKSAFIWESETILVNAKYDLLPKDLMIDKKGTQSEIAISLCSGLIAKEGSIMLNTVQNNFRINEIFPKIELILAHKEMLHYSIEKAVQNFKNISDTNPFLIQLHPNAQRIRTIDGKLVINSNLHESKKNRIVVVFYSEEKF